PPWMSSMISVFYEGCSCSDAAARARRLNSAPFSKDLLAAFPQNSAVLFPPACSTIAAIGLQENSGFIAACCAVNDLQAWSRDSEPRFNPTLEPQLRCYPPHRPRPETVRSRQTPSGSDHPTICPESITLG